MDKPNDGIPSTVKLMQRNQVAPQKGVVRFLVIVLLITGALAAGGPISAQTTDDAYTADPLRLVPFIDTVQQVYTTGTDTFEVWICDVPNWDAGLVLDDVVANLNSALPAYFEWLSGGVYRPQFVSGGEVASNDVIPTDISNRQGFSAPGCESEVLAASTGAPEGALIVVDGGFDEGYATAGQVCPEDPFIGCATTYPGNFRVAVVGAATVEVIPPMTEPQWIIAAHEIGHTLNWTHSYGGLTTVVGGTEISQYDNPMDVMSGLAVTGFPIGTIAYNRYAAGWIDPTDVAFHQSGTAQYELAALGSAGDQMLIVPIDDERHFYAIDARRRTSFDGTLIKSGVEIYEIDQRRTACSLPTEWPATWPCFATLIRVAQSPAVAGITGTAHVLTIDESLILGEITISVSAAGASSFTVHVEDARTGNRFIDDDGNAHEANIEAIAALGITEGCNPPLNNQFCPDNHVTRAEMAVFLVQAMGEAGNLPNYQGYFSDVLAGAWYTPWVERLSELGVTVGFPDGTFHPGDTVTRGQMAVFHVTAFDHAAELTDPTGVFADVDITKFYADDAELLRTLSITAGCAISPLRYCPDDPVRRDHMATFLAKSLGL